MIATRMTAPEDSQTARRESAEGEIAATVEAILFAAEKPLPPAKISEIGQLGGVRAVRTAVETLNGRYERASASFRVVEIAGGYQMQTLPEYSDVLGRLTTSRTESRLSQAALETLAIVAYRQPVLRADVEAIRGVACGDVLRGLMQKNLVRIVGRADEIGRPLLYGTTRHFLEVFGLASLDGLPDSEQLRRRPEPPEAGQDERRPATPDDRDSTDCRGDDAQLAENAPSADPQPSQLPQDDKTGSETA